MTKSIKRNRKGQFKKGTGGGPGRKRKGEIMGIPMAQAREVFSKVFTAVFNKSGDWKELVEFVDQNQLNKRLFLQEYRKLIPEGEGNENLHRLSITELKKSLKQYAEHERKELARELGLEEVTVTVKRIITDNRGDLPEFEHERIGQGKDTGQEEIARPDAPSEEKSIKESGPIEPEAMTDEELRAEIAELEKKRTEILATLEEFKPNKTKAKERVN